VSDFRVRAVSVIAPPSVESFQRRDVREREPVILRGLIEDWPARERWSLAYSPEALGERCVPVSIDAEIVFQSALAYRSAVHGAPWSTTEWAIGWAIRFSFRTREGAPEARALQRLGLWACGRVAAAEVWGGLRGGTIRPPGWRRIVR